MNQVKAVRAYAAEAPIEATQKELPSIVIQLESTVSDVDAALQRLHDRLAPVRMRLPTRDTAQGRAQLTGSSPVGEELAGQVNRLRNLVSAIEQLTDELAV
ncbi:hypothetical protein [Ottowia sp. VDI28]|uniref:hypothetical protein n=1 Tax=Ottowia sp. VDI28 TaxID=3133968 RepID=UPI003C2FD291